MCIKTLYLMLRTTIEFMSLDLVSAFSPVGTTVAIFGPHTILTIIIIGLGFVSSCY